jgi:heme/copper-type cytochrome/quinol oxidase subunit 2
MVIIYIILAIIVIVLVYLYTKIVKLEKSAQTDVKVTETTSGEIIIVYKGKVIYNTK